MDYKLSDLEIWDEKICAIAKKNGLDWFDIEYEFIDFYSMLGAMAFHGLPSHFNHWSFGKSFERTHRMYDLGMEGLPYELIINSDPSVAYMMRENPLYLQVLIMAHCVGHSDFFKNNRTFKGTRPGTIIGRCRAAKKRFQAYVEDTNIGIDKVEATIDACHAVQFQVQRPGWIRKTRNEIIEEYNDRLSYDSKIPELDTNKIPLEPDYDILSFISENAKLPSWKRDIIDVCQDEGRYFWPQIQTKVINEGWACVTGDTLVDTNDGLMTAKELVENSAGKVFDGSQYQKLIDWHHNPKTERVKITTSKGYVIHGSKNHRVWTGSCWKYLGELKLGETLQINKGNSTWAKEEQEIVPVRHYREDIENICKIHGVSRYQVSKYVNGKLTRASLEKLELAQKDIAANKLLHTKRTIINFPTKICKKVSNIIGMMIGDGGFYKYNNGRLKAGFTTGDDQLKELFCQQIEDVFGVRPKAKREENKWRISLGSDLIVKWFIETFDFHTGNTSSKKFIPASLLKSPKDVVIALLRGLFDTDGCADKSGNVIYVTTSQILSKQIHELLLKFGIISKLKHLPSKNQNHQDGYRIDISGKNADLYREEIGFNLDRKQERLVNAAKSRKWRCDKAEEMSVVSIEYDEGEVYDFTVDNTHQYRASAFMNHNSYQHYNILHELDLPPELHVAFIKSHNQVIRPHIGGINPYHLGFHLFQRIKERMGMEECFLAREVHHDASFLRQYLKQEDCEDLNLFSYSSKKDGYASVDDVSDEQGWEDVKADLINQVGGGSIPILKVQEVLRNGIIVLDHDHDGRDLESKETKATLEHLSYLWGNTVHLNTVMDGSPYKFAT